MKKILLILMLLACVVGTASAITYDEDNYKKYKTNCLTAFGNDPIWNFIDEVSDILEGESSSTIISLLFSQETSAPTATEGMFYYNATSEGLYVRDSDSWNLLAMESGTVSLDVAYNNGNAITVDGTVLTLTVTDAANNSALYIDNNEGTNNNDGMLISQSGTGDALQIEPQDVDSGGLNIVAKASGTVPLAILDGSTNNIDLADDKGQLLIQCDDPYIAAGASGLVILDSSTPITAAEGFLARFVHSGAARTNSSAVEIEVPATQPALAMNGILAITGQDNAGAALVQISNTGTNGNNDAVTIASNGTGDGLQITAGDADSVAARLIAAASQTTSLAVFDAATSNWDGADDIGMVHIVADDPLVHIGASLLYVVQSGTPIATAEGFLARFVQSGTATTDATAVEIEVKATQPALAVNGLVTFTQQDNSGGTMLSVVGVAAGDDQNAMLISLTGAGNCLQVTPGETDTGGINITSLASSTVSMVTLDGATNNWDGADNVGQLTLTQDDAVVHTGASQLVVINGGTTVAAAEGFLARFIQHTGAAVTDAYAVEIETTATTPCLKLNGQMSIAGQGATDGVLLDIISADTDDDTVQLTGIGSGDVLQITANATTSVGINAIAKAAATVSLAKFDAATNNVNMANDIGLVQLSNDTALAHVGATLLYVGNVTGAPIASAEGFLARFVDSGTADTSSYAVEIETTNTTPCLHLNNELVITGADSAGTLMTITGADVTGDSDTLVMTHRGDASALKITTAEPVGTGIEVVCDAAQTSAAILVDGSTGAAWLGAANVGMVHLQSDGGLADVGSSLLYIANSGVPTSNAMGSSLRIVDTGNAAAGTGYAVYISADDAEMEALKIDNGGVLFDEYLTVTGAITSTTGVQSSSVARTANAAFEGGTSVIASGTAYVTVTSAGVNNICSLPVAVVGNVVTIYVGANGFELQTPDAGSPTINQVDCSGGDTNEAAIPANTISTLTCYAANAWTLVNHTYAGAFTGAITPDGV